MSQPATHHAAPVDEIAAAIREDLTTTLRDLGAHLELVRSLVDSRQRSLGFLTPDGREALDELLRTERTQRLGQPHDGHGEDVGLKWLNRDTSIAGTGEVGAPVTVNAASLEAIAWSALSHIVTTTTRHLLRADSRRGWCEIPGGPRDIPLELDNNGALVWPATSQLVNHLINLTDQVTDHQILTATLRDLENLLAQAETVVDGADRTRLGDCPHCGRDTLVVYFRGPRETDPNTGRPVRHERFIRCDKDNATGRYEKCVCGSDWCPCKTNPFSHRHTWWHNPRNAPDPRTAHDWHDLAGRLNIRRKTKEHTP